MPHMGASVDARNELFQRLKKSCVGLVQAAASIRSGHKNQQNIVDILENLDHVVTNASPHFLDSRLSEYVFFPLAQLLKESRKLSIRCLELCLKCLSTLLEQGWQHELPPPLALQIAILCTSLGEKNPKHLAFQESTDELQTWSISCLGQVFVAAGASDAIKELLASEANVPQLGQTISVLLDALEAGESVELQLAAVGALDGLVQNVLDTETQASFLPGMVSKLTKVLTPQSKQRRNPGVLAACFSVLAVLLGNTMNDHQIGHQSERSIIDEKWQQAAVIQLKPALSNILRQASHPSDTVRSSVARLCLVVLSHCRHVLAKCTDMALTTLIDIAARPDRNSVDDQVESLLRSEPSIVVSLQTMLYNWLERLPIAMQGADEQAKGDQIEKIKMSYTLLVRNGVSMTTLNRITTTAIRDSAAVSLTDVDSKQQSISSISAMQPLSLTQTSSDTHFSSLARHKGQEVDLNRLEGLATLVMKHASSTDFGAELVRNLRTLTGESQLANFWLLLVGIEASMLPKQGMDAFIDMDSDTVLDNDEILEEVYSFALSILNASSEEAHDPRLQALALRGLALRARSAGVEFRYELVDALYPVLHSMATSNDSLQQDGITTLDIITSSCGYSSAKDLIIDNIDYLTNAVALKFNAFDVSPQAPRVLSMMVRLAGASLLPYLEDTVDSIFAALEDYHGYPLLVELLFKALSGIAEEGVNAPQLAITEGHSQRSTKTQLEAWHPTTVHGLATLLQQHATDQEQPFDVGSDYEPHPERPWKAVEDEDIAEDAVDAALQQTADETDQPPPAPKTYNLLFKITELTQHFLPSASPSLRTSLLSLIKTTVPAIACHENTFLPLINTLWPEVVSRLDDDELYTVASAIEVIGLLCEYAGDFMRTRVENIWPRLVELHGTPRKNGISTADATSQQHVSAYTGNTAGQLLANSITSATTRILRFVPLGPGIFDEALSVLETVLDEPQVHESLEACNTDALWLTEVKLGRIVPPHMPVPPDGSAWLFAPLPV